MARSLVLTNIGQLLTMTGDGLGIVENAWLRVEEGRVTELGRDSGFGIRDSGPIPDPRAPIPDSRSPFPTPHSIDCRGCVVLPGFVDPHTHLVFGGWRADEYELRLAGRSYEDIARAGGGILSTVKATRAATEDELYQRALERLREMSAWGTTTVEVKSGYGLETETELKMLRVARRLGQTGIATIVPTFLGAHALPAARDMTGLSDNPDRVPSPRERYVQLLIDEMLPLVEKENLARFCDVFCETIAFNPEESARILTAAKKHGLLATVHADEIDSSGGAEVAAEVGAVSASHLLRPSDEGLRGMADKGVVAILLPGTCFFLRKEARPPVDRMRELGIAMALATDFNPGSCTLLAQPVTVQLGCIHYGLTIVEALRAVTVNAARALRMESEIGTLEPGKQADIVITDLPDYRHLAYRLAHNPVRFTLRAGQVVHTIAR